MNTKMKLNPKKLRINMSKKEKSLLLLLIMVVLIFVFYKFLLTPQQKNLLQIEDEKIKDLDKFSQINTVLAKEASLNKELAELSSEYQQLNKKYYSGINQPEIMYELNKIIYESNLTIPNISFSSPEILEIEEVKVDSLSVSLPYRGTYKDLNDFLKKLRDNPKKLLVSQLSMAKDVDDLLSGQINLEVFSNGSQSGAKDTFYYNNSYEPIINDNPFESFGGFTEEEYLYDDFEGFDNEADKRIVMDDLETGKAFFMGTSSDVTGDLSRVNFAKNGKTSLRLEYFISTNFKEERAYVVLDDRDINFKYPPDSIGVWAYSYGYSPVTVGMRFQDLDGRKIDMELARGISWMGWEYISASPPKDLSIYPLKLDRIYLQLEPNRNEFGVILFDGIEVTQPKSGEDGEEKELPNFEFYLVKPGDTLKSISKDFYGTESKYNKIASNNGLDANIILEVGTVLVIEK